MAITPSPYFAAVIADALHRAADLAMEHINKQQSAEAPTPTAQSAALADIETREADGLRKSISSIAATIAHWAARAATARALNS